MRRTLRRWWRILVNFVKYGDDVPEDRLRWENEDTEVASR